MLLKSNIHVQVPLHLGCGKMLLCRGMLHVVHSTTSMTPCILRCSRALFKGYQDIAIEILLAMELAGQAVQLCGKTVCPLLRA